MERGEKRKEISVSVTPEDFCALSVASSVFKKYGGASKKPRTGNDRVLVTIDDPRHRGGLLGALLGPVVDRNIKIAISSAASGPAATGGDIFQAMTNYNGPDYENGDDQYCDFDTILKAYRGDNGYLKETLYNLAAGLNNNIISQIFPWEKTSVFTWTKTLQMVEPTIAEPSGPQSTTPGISLAERSMSYAIQEYKKEFDVDGTLLLTQKGVEQWILKCRSFIESFVIRVNRNGITMLMNYEAIHRFYQSLWSLRCKTTLQAVFSNRSGNAFPIQKGGYRDYVAVIAIMRDHMRKSELVSIFGAVEPSTLICAEGIKLLLGTTPSGAEYLLQGDRIRDNLDRADDSKGSVLTNINLLEYRSDNVKDDTAPNEFVGTLFARKSFSGWMSRGPNDFQAPLKDYKSIHLYAALPNFKSGENRVFSLSDLVKNACLFHPGGGLLNKVYETKALVNGESSLISFNLGTNGIPKKFKDNAFPLFENIDIAAKKGNGKDYYDVAVYTGELSKADIIAKMAVTVLNDKAFVDLLPALNRAKTLSRSLSDNSGRVASAAQIGLVAAAIAQHALDGGDADNAVGTNEFGGYDFPTLVRGEDGRIRIMVRPERDGAPATFISTGGALVGDGTNALFIQESDVSAKGWGNVSGILTLAALASQPAGTGGRNFISDEVINSAVEAAEAFRAYTKLFEKVFPGHPCLDVNNVPRFLRAKQDSITRVLSVCQNFVLGAMYPFYFNFASINLGGRRVATDANFGRLTLGGLRNAFADRIAPVVLANRQNFETFLEGFNTTPLAAANVFGSGLGGSSSTSPVAFEAFYNAAALANPGQEYAVLRRILDREFYRGFNPTGTNKAARQASAVARASDPNAPVSSIENFNTQVWGAPATSEDDFRETRLFFGARSFVNQGLSSTTNRDRYYRAANQTSGAKLRVVDESYVDSDFASVEALSFFNSGAYANRIANAPGAGGVAQSRKDHDPNYISTRLQDTVIQGLNHSLINSSVLEGLFVAISTSLCCKEKTWLAWDVSNVLFPAKLKVTRPCRNYRISSAVLVDKRGFGRTLYNPDISNVKIGQAMTQRWLKVSGQLTTMTIVDDPTRVQRHDEFFCHAYEGGEDDTFFDLKDHPFKPRDIRQTRSNLVTMGHPDERGEIVDFGPLKGFYERDTFALENNGAVYEVDYNAPTTLNAIYYYNVHNFNALPVARAPDPKISFNKDVAQIEQIGGGQMIFFQYSRNSRQYDYVDATRVTDVFGPLSRTKSGRNGKMFAEIGANVHLVS